MRRLYGSGGTPIIIMGARVLVVLRLATIVMTSSLASLLLLWLMLVQP